jgi:hypothetical protein
MNIAIRPVVMFALPLNAIIINPASVTLKNSLIIMEVSAGVVKPNKTNIKHIPYIEGIERDAIEDA